VSYNLTRDEKRAVCQWLRGSIFSVPNSIFSVHSKFSSDISLLHTY